jgi:hypothetical protein
MIQAGLEALGQSIHPPALTLQSHADRWAWQQGLFNHPGEVQCQSVRGLGGFQLVQLM